MPAFYVEIVHGVVTADGQGSSDKWDNKLHNAPESVIENLSDQDRQHFLQGLLPSNAVKVPDGPFFDSG